MKKSTSAVIIASGFAKRFGKDKLLSKWKGNTLLYHIIRQAVFSDVSEIIIVIQEKHITECENYARLLEPCNSKRIKICINSRASEGMASSIRLGVSQCSEKSNAVLFLLADQPFFYTHDINYLCKAFYRKKASILAPFYRKERKNPVIFDLNKYKQELLQVHGDKGARELLQKYSHEVQCLDFTDDLKFTDIDTQKDYTCYKELLFSWKDLLSSYRMVSIIGAGGKTSLMWNIVKDLRKNGVTSLASTTTKIWNALPDNMELIFAEHYTENEIAIAAENKSIFLASSVDNNNKIIGLNSNYLDTLTQEEVKLKIIVEADGAKEKIFKIHNEYEPVIPLNTELVLIVVNIHLLGKIFSQKHVHRIELMSSYAQKKCTIKNLYNLLISSNGYFNKASNSKQNLSSKKDTPFILYINGVEQKKHYKDAMKLINIIKKNSSIFPFKNLQAFLYGSNKLNYYELKNR